MSKGHNKKRNIGIIYELLLRSISESLISDNKSSAKKALRIIERRFNKSSEIYREFRLFNALANSTVSSSAIAAAILTEAKQAARRCDVNRLNREKSMLLREINHDLSDKMFYHRRIKRYRDYGNIQMLLNEWRKSDLSNLSRVIVLETGVVEGLLEKKEQIELHKHTNGDIDNLVVKIMTEKLNKKYLGKLSESQSDMIKRYVFSIKNDNGEEIKSHICRIKDDTLSKMKMFSEMTDNKYLLSKINDVNKKIINESVDVVSDDTISKFLTLTKLSDEIEEAVNESTNTSN